MAGCDRKIYRQDKVCPGRVAIEEDGTEEWVVEQIISKKKEAGKWKYEIKWYGWSHKYNTWEPASNLTNCQEKFDEFEREYKKQQKKGSKKTICENGQPTIKTEQGDAGTPVTSGRHDADAEEDMETDNKKNHDGISVFEEELSELDEIWLGGCVEMFRRKWKPTEKPLCVLGSAVVNNALLHLVRIRCATDPENVSDPEEGVTTENSVLVLSRTFGEKFPHILIPYYESRFMLLDQLKSDETLVKVAARAGLASNLLDAKVDANYRAIYRDMMPLGQGDELDDNKDDRVPDKKPKVEGEQKKVVGLKEAKDEYGLPYYYEGESDGTFKSDDEGSSDDSDDWEEVKSKKTSQQLKKKQTFGSKE